MATRTSGKDLVSLETESSLSKVAAKEVSKAVTLAAPWVVALFGYGLATALHFILYSPGMLAVWSSVVTVCAIVLTGVAFGQSHARGPWGKTHTTVSTFLAGMWTVAVVITGPAHPIVWRLGVVGGITMALSWNIRSVIRMKGWDNPGAVSDPLAFLFGKGAEKAGMPGVAATTTKATDHKTEFEVQLQPGKQTPDDLQRKLGYVESGMGLPPGSLTTTADPDDASKARGWHPTPG
ncbi:hypothetical protein [Spongiactinospora sp. TRM90649]|uniref:hypothetical protein n=1 Tax=Spongiactinospora sp. TRM90649 TaxID=3031114 RepID=UPI0023F9C165|nr:hypothetical protein [Spongiactinospora sp. TRM90649]MDF5759120.1 hypothetical protein [Spongiactinospora sp. TRM90649]